MKRRFLQALAFVCLIAAFAPWVFAGLVAPMAWVLFDVNLYPVNMRGVGLVAALPVFFVWTLAFALFTNELEWRAMKS